MAYARCAADHAFLVSKKRPDHESAPSPIQLVDLFAAGGLTIGVAEAARRTGRGTEVALAVENDDRAADIYGLNFQRANLVRASVEAVFDGDLAAPFTAAERSVALAVGEVDVLVAGPPCQGHSNLTNHTRRQDPRDATLVGCRLIESFDSEARSWVTSSFTVEQLAVCHTRYPDPSSEAPELIAAAIEALT